MSAIQRKGFIIGNAEELIDDGETLYETEEEALRAVMVDEVTRYECSECNELYEDEYEAEACCEEEQE